MDKLHDLQKRLDRLPPAEQLQVAAMLMAVVGREELAIAIAENVVTQYQAAKLFRKV